MNLSAPGVLTSFETGGLAGGHIAISLGASFEAPDLALAHSEACCLTLCYLAGFFSGMDAGLLACLSVVDTVSSMG